MHWQLCQNGLKSKIEWLNAHDDLYGKWKICSSVSIDSTAAFTELAFSVAPHRFNSFNRQHGATVGKMMDTLLFIYYVKLRKRDLFSICSLFGVISVKKTTTFNEMKLTNSTNRMANGRFFLHKICTWKNVKKLVFT